MMIEHIVKGSADSTLCTFLMSAQGMDIQVSKGSFIQGGKEFFAGVGASFTVPVSAEDLHYAVYLTTTGITVDVWSPSEVPSSIENLLTQLGWFFVPKNTTSLEAIDIHIVKVVESNED
jgi:hypothetical protein